MNARKIDTVTGRVFGQPKPGGNWKRHAKKVRARAAASARQRSINAKTAARFAAWGK